MVKESRDMDQRKRGMRNKAMEKKIENLLDIPFIRQIKK